MPTEYQSLTFSTSSTFNTQPTDGDEARAYYQEMKPSQ